MEVTASSTPLYVEEVVDVIEPMRCLPIINKPEGDASLVPRSSSVLVLGRLEVSLTIP